MLADAGLSRRRLLALGVSSAGALVGSGVVAPGASARALLTQRRIVWALNPGAGCSGCRACRRHAANKLFRTAHAAQTGRAHPHCDCTVVRAGTVSLTTWIALFVKRNGARRVSVDRRAAAVRRVLNARSIRRI